MPRQTHKRANGTATFLALLPRHTPQLDMMLDDIGAPGAAELAKALGVSPRTAARWQKTGEAPRAVMLALYYVTRWGRSDVHCQAHNDARQQAALAFCLKTELDKANARLASLGQIGDFGSANDPLPMAPTNALPWPVIDVPGAPLETTVQPRKTARVNR